MKKLMPEHVEYWIKKGMNEVDARNEATRRAGGRSKSNKNYWLLRGYTEAEAETNSTNAKLNSHNTRENKIKKHGSEEKYLEWVKQTCGLSKENMLKRMSIAEYTEHKKTLGQNIGLMKPQFKEYWLVKGYSEEESVEKAKHASRLGSVRCIEHWLAKGYTEEEAVDKIHELQNITSLKKFISRYGEIEGEIRYKNFVELMKNNSKRTVNYWMILGYTESEAILKVSEYQTENANKNHANISYWLELGYSLEDAEELRFNTIAIKFANCKLYWTSKGYTDAEAVECVKLTQSSRGKLGILSQRLKSKSELESKFNDLITDHDKIWSSVIVRECDGYYFPDFEFDKFYVEINGDYWHGNPNIYGPDAKIGGNILAKEKWLKDKNRNDEITKLTGKPVIVIWESEFTDLKEIKRKIDEYIKNI